MSLTIKFWGVRGSLPSAPTPTEWTYHIEGVLRNFFSLGYRDLSQVSKYIKSIEEPVVGGYGTATTSVELRCGRSQIIIDGGSGIRTLSESIMTGTLGRAKGPFHIFMTHFHWDHVIGLPFFTPHFIPGSEIHYYAVQSDLEQLIRGIFKRPYFPVPFEDLKAKIHFHVLEPRKPVKVDDFTVTPFKLDHPDPCWGYKVEAAGKTYAHCVDTEGTRVTPEELGEDLPLYQNVDVMYFDAQYTLPELAEKANWGHSAAQVGLEIALREGIRRVLFAHHDPGARSEHVMELKRQTGEYYQSLISKASENKENINEIIWDFAHEGLEIVL
ncbi:MBL fold metallo-hydrolase [Bdellovibrio svalbardensis]|uniref:MBL fold metallo-hydrolase n=1 Tax=Bdellovibrio svalbardensis TaxID=2972972 RepID=A0ABT6DEX5_9BACT|nr:MBL fold metallo-hydrolase [Bdellovibrio svalbardensis]MDG0815393.1 MBL fold metallo-hydrolase [Bdellovibrio svalbardensis]